MEKLIAKMPTNYEDTRCWDCQKETNHQLTKKGEWYMVEDEIWHIAMKKGHADFLCISCLEKRIKRTLTPKDFNNAPLNYLSGYRRSKTLINRMGGDGLIVPK